jgi:hypothetical protein
MANHIDALLEVAKAAKDFFNAPGFIEERVNEERKLYKALATLEEIK